MKIFLTGAGGFIGSALARSLAAAGHELTALVRDVSRVRAAPGPPGPEIRWIPGDLSRPGGLDAALGALQETDAIAHVAAVRKDWGLAPDALRRVNVESGPALLERAPRARRFLFVSSVAVYGHPEGGAADERAPFRPSKRYGVSKVEAEAALREAARRRSPASLTIARPGITYGPGDTYGMVANMARLIAARRFLLVGSGQSRLNLLWVDDLALGLRRALESDAAGGEDFLFAGPEALTVERVARTIATATGRELPPLKAPETLARVGAFLLERAYGALGVAREPFLTKAKVDLFTREDLWDTAKARERLGFDPKVTLAEGAPRFVAWLREAGEVR